VVPDLVVTDAGATAEDTVSVDADAVQLVVELVSPGNKTMDRKFKPLLYAEAAIPHFWRLEFDPAPRLIVSELHAGRYVETTTALAGATTRINAPFPVDIDPAGLTRGASTTVRRGNAMSCADQDQGAGWASPVFSRSKCSGPAHVLG
jgi:hypothetical protein